MKYVPIVISLFVAQAPSSVGDLHLPHYEWNACPFECCVYRTWTAKAVVKVLKERRGDSPVAFELQPGESVQALTGVVVTTRAGELRVAREGRVGHANTPVRPGDIVRILRPEGEGVWKIWFQGQTDTEELLDLNKLSSDSIFQVVSSPEFTWWVKVRTRSGRAGWTTATDRFGGTDACGR